MQVAHLVEHATVFSHSHLMKKHWFDHKGSSTRDVLRLMKNNNNQAINLKKSNDIFLFLTYNNVNYLLYTFCRTYCVVF